MDTPTTIGIVSTGRFATVLKNLFSRTKSFLVLQSSTTRVPDHKDIFPLNEVLRADIIFLCIPISSMQMFLAEHGKDIRPDALVVDVSSVKQLPAQWMAKLLPETVDILATHPIFGPHSTKDGTTYAHLPWVFCPLRIRNTRRFAQLQSFIVSQLIDILDMTPQEHDRIMARSQAVSFLFGSICSRLGLTESPIDTKGFSLLLENQRIVEGDSQQLFIDVMRFNQDARRLIDQVEDIVHTIKGEMQL